jgi:hypothetical protein
MQQNHAPIQNIAMLSGLNFETWERHEFA